MPERENPPPDLTRRGVLRGAAVGGVTLPLLAACGSDSEPSGTGAAAGGTTVPTAEVPVGGGTILADAQVVVTQPAEGEFKAFSAVCTHMGCSVQEIDDGKIICPCHGSAFSVEDGSVVEGPAEEPLEEQSLSVEGDTITLG